MKKIEKKSHNSRKKTERGTFGIFQHPFCRKTPQKMKAEPLQNMVLSKRSRTISKK